MNTSDKTRSIIEGFSKLNVMILGDVMIDSYLWGDTQRVSPEAPVPIVHISKKENRMGGAANVALNIRALGAKPIVCTMIGDDNMAGVYRNLLVKRGMTDQGVLSSKNCVTTQKTRVISQNQHIVRIDDEKVEYLNAEDESRLFKKIKEILDSIKIDVIIFEDYNKGVLTPYLIDNTINEAIKRGIPTSVDPKKTNFFAYNRVTLFKPNLKEFVEGLKLNETPDTPQLWEDGLAQLRSRINHRFTFVTLSEKGVLIEDKGSVFFYPAHLRNIADVSGAGDTVIGVASLCLASGTSSEFLARLANLAGGLVCEKAGVVPIEKEQLIEEAGKYNL